METDFHRFAAPTLLLSLLLSSATVKAEGIDCDSLPHWSDTAPQVNQTHVFCGEWSNNRAKGFHSRPGGDNPSTVASATVTQPPNAQDIYGINWEYAGHDGSSKFSTMYPDACSQAQVLTSVLHAAANPTACPKGAPRWAKCGVSHPMPAGAEYCAAGDGQPYVIAFAYLGSGTDRINTAFPLR